MTDEADLPIPQDLESNSRSQYGATETLVGRTTGTYCLVELGSRSSESVDIETRAYAYDDEDTRVEVSIRGPLPVTLTLSAPEAHELADELATAAIEATGDTEERGSQ